MDVKPFWCDNNEEQEVERWAMTSTACRCSRSSARSRSALGTRAKTDIHKTAAHNPVIQDVHKDGSLREYMYSPSIVNYGAIAQTWEDPKKPDDDTGFGGDNDPIDVLQLNGSPCKPGGIQRVRVLGALALVDDDETDSGNCS